MIAKYQKPPYQPKWILQLQVFLLRHLKSSFNKQTMIITTTGRKTGHKHAVPIGFIPDGDTYIAINLGGHSNWYLNALAHPRVTLEVNGEKFDAAAKPISTKTTGDIRQVLAVIERERPDLYKNFFGLTYKLPSDEDVINIRKRAAFIRFCPLP